jgi:GT2 family glycosyltransferase
MKYSVLMTIYSKNDPSQLRDALQSLLDQTIKPGEIVLVEDGPVSAELKNIISHFNNVSDGLLKSVCLKSNIGISRALNEGLKHVSNELVGRMDGDDIAKPNRFAKQLEFFEKNPDHALVGGQIEEFIERPGDTKILRKLPLRHEDLARYASKRCPFNHPAVMYKKSVIQAVGGYEDFNSPTEDYFLWCKVINSGYRVANLPDILLDYRIGYDFVERRTGFKYMKGEYTLFTKLKSIGFLNQYEYLRNLVSRLPLRILPLFMTRFIYNRVLR